jgi:NAD(P)-dependent dehydrogenase (short-subunit alcohol dehydrogenase family)
MTAQRLLGKKCIVTGGSSGIGLAIGRQFAAEGAREIILVARNQERLNRLKNAHDREGLGSFAYRAGDVAGEECWGALKKEMVSRSTCKLHKRVIID